MHVVVVCVHLTACLCISYFQKTYSSREYCGRDGLGNKVYKRPADQPVRFSTYNPGVHPDAFFYNVLLEYVPFTRECDLFGADNQKARDSFKECVRFGIITSEDDLQVRGCEVGGYDAGGDHDFHACVCRMWTAAVRGCNNPKFCRWACTRKAARVRGAVLLLTVCAHQATNPPSLHCAQSATDTGPTGKG